MADFIASNDHDPNEVTDYSIDWSDWLVADSINSSTWALPPGIVNDSDSNTSTTTTIWVSGGTSEQEYELKNTVVTNGGRTETRSILIVCRLIQSLTISGWHIIDDIRFAINDETLPYSFSTDRINRLIRRAVEYYSMFRPNVRTGTLTTVADQDIYALPSDCLQLTECKYRTAASVENESISVEYPWMYEHWDYPSLVMIRNELVSRYDEMGQGAWKQFNSHPSYTMTSYANSRSGRYVMLYPTPTAADSVPIQYAALHASTQGHYATVPAEDAQIIINLVVSDILHRKATEMQMGVIDYRAGQTRMVWSPGELRNEARSRRSDAIRALQSPTVLRGRRGTP